MAKDTIKVKPTDKAGDRVVLWERDDRHPGGEIWLAGNSDEARREVVEVFPTTAVKEAIHDGRLEEVKGK
jgi:hypothetical protein